MIDFTEKLNYLSFSNDDKFTKNDFTLKLVNEFEIFLLFCKLIHVKISLAFLHLISRKITFFHEFQEQQDYPLKRQPSKHYNLEL